MKNKSLPKLLFVFIIGLLVATYNLLLFLIKKDFSAVSWVVYAFTMFSFVILFIDLFIPRDKFGKYPMFGLPVTMFALWYFLIQFCFGVLVMFFNEFELTVAWVVEILLLAGYGISVALVMLSREVVGEQDEKVKKKSTTSDQ